MNFERLKQIVRKELKFCSAHGFDHVMRVYNMALRLAKGEEVDLDVVKAAALLHDIGGGKEANDPTGQTDHAIEGAKMAGPILREQGFSEEKIKHIQDCIRSHRFRNENEPQSREAVIVFEADKLETVGAIGLARAFAWVGKHNAHIYKKTDIDEYARENLGGRRTGRIQDKSKHSPQINWETKEKHILEYLYTEKAKEIARERKKFVEEFYSRLEKEVYGKL